MALLQPATERTQPAVADLSVASPVSEPTVTKEWSLTAEERNEVSASISQTWTDQAVKCFKIGANCSQCEIPRGNYSFVCQMNKVVPILLESVGEPDERRVKKLFPMGVEATIQAQPVHQRSSMGVTAVPSPLQAVFDAE